MDIVCLDLEGVLVPEIWINVAEQMQIPELRATTRDIPDYDELMKQRLEILDRHSITIRSIQAVIESLGPLPGAREFLSRLRETFQVVILSDTFYEFASPLMKQLGWPTLLCHRLEIGPEGRITNYLLRQPDAKRAAVSAFQDLRFKIIAAGDSYNDTNMLAKADAGILFSPPANVVAEFPQFPTCFTYEELWNEIVSAKNQLAKSQ